MCLYLCSNSVADGLKLYQIHISTLKDAAPTIEFTRKMNDLFDILNSRVPVNGIRLNCNHDKLKVNISFVI
jgi:hypothetical protein